MSILRLSKSDRRQISGFVSIYGAYAPGVNLSSHRLYGDGRFGLSEAQMRWFWNLYAPQLPPEERGKQLSPLTADLSDFPPTLCIGAECDVLLDDTLAFYGELARACIDVSLSVVVDPAARLHALCRRGRRRRRGPPGGIVQFVDSRRQRPQAVEREAIFALPRSSAPAARAKSTFGPIEADATVSEPVLVDVEPLFTTSRSRLHGSVAHRIATDIIKGALPEGSLLPNEDNASASFGVSRSAYREAIRTLAAKGLVSALPKVGTRIAPRSKWHILDPDILAWQFELGASEEFIRNLFELRKIVEPSAAALAAMRRNQEQLSRLADSLARMAPHEKCWSRRMAECDHRIPPGASGRRS